MQPDRTREAWLPWELAVKYVECHRGWSWGKAAKAANDAIASGQVTDKVRPRYPEPDDGPDAPDYELVKTAKEAAWTAPRRGH